MGGGMKEWLIRAQKSRSETMSRNGQIERARACSPSRGSRQGRLKTGITVGNGYPSPCGCAL